MIVLPLRPVQAVTKESWWLLPGRWSVLLPSLGLWLPGVITEQLSVCSQLEDREEYKIMWPSWCNATVCLQVNSLFWNTTFSCFLLFERALYVRWSYLDWNTSLFPKLQTFKKTGEILIWTDIEIFQENLHFHSAFVKSEDAWFYCEVKPSCILWSSANSAYQINRKKKSCNTSKF